MAERSKALRSGRSSPGVGSKPTPDKKLLILGAEYPEETSRVGYGDNQANSHASGKGQGENRVYRPLVLKEKPPTETDGRAVQGAAFRSQSGSPGYPEKTSRVGYGDNQENSHASGKGQGENRVYRPQGLTNNHLR
ncbi:hypothetical protein DPMN_052907 [Dreissena polymorpha]|uniref:Uncharacterized protein n=1 Tax=Dreissena polymorpha TaxID=45954 RepID=A0A9D4HQ88_DREPO|nr:hypothetical protein DPMN_052907 [Dreissena polymorpha]